MKTIEPSEFDLKLMREARDRRDQMIRDGSPCCVNCRWSIIGPTSPAEEENARTWAAHYIHCSWPRLNHVADSIGRFVRPNHDPIVQHMGGRTCATFELNHKKIG